MSGDAAFFFGLWLQEPLQIAAVTPSGKELARTMAGLVQKPVQTRPSSAVETE